MLVITLYQTVSECAVGMLEPQVHFYCDHCTHCIDGVTWPNKTVKSWYSLPSQNWKRKPVQPTAVLYSGAEFLYTKVIIIIIIAPRKMNMNYVHE